MLECSDVGNVQNASLKCTGIAYKAALQLQQCNLGSNLCKAFHTVMGCIQMSGVEQQMLTCSTAFTVVLHRLVLLILQMAPCIAVAVCSIDLNKVLFLVSEANTNVQRDAKYSIAPLMLSFRTP